MHVPFSDPIIQSDFEKVTRSEISAKIDLITVSISTCTDFNMPSQPKNRLIFKNSAKAKSERKEYENKIKDETKELIYSVNRELLSVWFNRDYNGFMGDATLKKKGSYSAVQQDMTINNSSEIARLDEIGYDLISKSFINVYKVKSLKTYKEIYDESDRVNKELAAKLGKQYFPEIRYNSGFVLDYDVLFYNLIWNEEAQNDFYTNYYVDSTLDESKDVNQQKMEKQKKVNNYRNLKVPANLLSVYNLTSTSIANTNPEYESGQTKYYWSQLPDPKLINSKDKTPPPPIDYEKKGDVAVSTGNYGAALDFYKNAYKAAVKEKKDTKVIEDKMIPVKLELARLYSTFENNFYNNKVN